jgi:competence protein ComFC
MRWIYRFKYQGATWLARPLAHTLLHAHGSDLQSGGWDGVIGVPLNGLRIRERGYNQSELLAEELGRELGVGVMRGVVRRVKRTGTQTGLSREERFENMRGAFEPGLGVEGVAGGHVLLVDDVMTTGATVDGCARVLKRAGARSVGVLAVVRGMYY